MFHSLKLAARSLLARPLRTFLTAFAIVLGVSVILAIEVTNVSTLDSITDLFDEASGKAQLIVISEDADPEAGGFPEAAVTESGKTPGVAAAVPSVHAQTLLAEDAQASTVSIGFYTASTTGLLLYGIDPLLDEAAREYRLVAGRFLAGDDDYEVVLVEEFAEEKGLSVGSEMEVVTPGGVERLEVVGLISRDGPGRLNNGDFGVIPISVAQDIFERGTDVDQIDIVASREGSSGTALDDLKQRLQEALGDDYSVTYPATQGERVTQMLDAYQFGLSFFSAIALFVGAFLIYNAFSMNLVERTREIGMLRAVGMTRGQVIRQILIEALILGLLGSGLGLLAGLGLARGLIRTMEFLLSQEMTLADTPPAAVVRGVVVGVVTTVVAAALPAWQASRVSPLEALRARAVQRETFWVRRGWPAGIVLIAAGYIFVYHISVPPEVLWSTGQFAVFALFIGATLVIPATVGAWERISRPVFRLLYGNEGALGSSNIRRSRSRTTLTAAALMVGVAMILGIRGLTGSFAHDLESWINSYIGGDLYVYSSVPIRADLARRLEAIEGVEVATPVRFMTSRATSPSGERDDIAVVFVEPGTHTLVGDFVFSSPVDEEAAVAALDAGDAVFLSSVIAEKYGLAPGEAIEIETRRGMQQFAVAAVVVDFYNRGMVVEASWKDMRRYWRSSEANLFFLKLQEGANPQAVRLEIDALYGERRHLSVESNTELRARAMTLADRGIRMFDVLALIAVVVGSFGVVNTLMMNVTERTREIGALRGLGMTRWQVSRMILAEAGIMGLIGGAFGLAFGLFLSRVFLMAVTSMRDYNITYVLPTSGIVLGIVLAAVVSQVAAILPATRAARLRIVDAIQYE